MQPVFDSSTLILLAKTGLLRDVAEDFDIAIPVKVRDECLAKACFDAALIQRLIDEDVIEVKRAGNTPAVDKLRRDFNIHTGEAEALWLATKLGTPLAVDDGLAIKACKVMNLRFTTAIHFLIHLSTRNRWDDETAMAKLETLSTCGRYSNRIIENAAKRLTEGRI